MTKDQKKTEDDFLSAIKDKAKGAFKEAAHGTAKDLGNMADEARKGINLGRRLTAAGYDIFEKTVGKERIIGAALGAKAGGMIGIIGGPAIAAKLGTAGAVAGFLGGKKFIDWLNKEQDNDKPDDPPPAPPAKPDDPAP